MQVENSISNFREQECEWKIPFPIFGNGNASGKFHSQFLGMGMRVENSFPTFGTGIVGRYSRKWPGTGIPAHPCYDVASSYGGALKVHKKVPALFKVPIIVPKRVPLPQKSSQCSALKSVPKKLKKKVQFKVL